MAPSNQDENIPPRDSSKNGRASIANRDQPAFKNRRQYRSSNVVPEFFTESLNTSYASQIPSPSPGRPSYGGRSRSGQERGRGNNGRGLAAAFNSLRSSANDSESNNSSPTRSAGRRSAQRSRQSFLPSPQRSPNRTPSPNKGLARHEHPFISDTKTPSPTRGRQREDLVSPTPSDVSHFSSPPVGLADVYQRIQDEELLAGQEEDENDLTEGEDWPEDRALQNNLNGQNRRSLQSRSPEARRRISPRPQLNLDTEYTACQGEDPSERLSLISELESASRESSPFEENPRPEPDDDMASQHERDEMRVKNALSHHHPFTKARRPRKSGLTTDNLRRAEGSQSGSNSTGSRSISSRASEMSLNVPNGWGRKGRTSKSWLNRIAEDGSFVSKVLEDVDAPQPDTKSDSIVDWMEAASATPLPQVGKDALHPSTSSPNLFTAGARSALSPPKRPAQSRAQSTTPTSTPPQRARNLALDALRVREIQDLAQSSNKDDAFTDELLRERPSSSEIRTSDRDRTESPAKSDRQALRIEDPQQVSKSQPLVEDEISQIIDLKNLPPQEQSKLRIDPSRKPLFKTTTVVYESKMPREATAETNGVNIAANRPTPARSDSRDILRTLSRVESSSPSPHRSSHEASLETRAEDSPEPGNSKEPVRQREQTEEANEPTAAKTKQPEQNEPEKSMPKPAQEEREKLLSATSTSKPAPVERTPTPRTEKPKVYLKTPLVTGGWIDTPLPTVKRDPRKDRAQQAAEQKALIDAALVEAGAEHLAKGAFLVEGNKQTPLRLEDTAPKLPGSALADIIQQAKAKRKGQATEDGDDTLLLDDSTLDSLEDLVVVSDNEDSAPNGSSEVSQPLQSNTKGKEQSTERVNDESDNDDKISQPRTAAEAYAHLAKRLTHLHSTIHDANKEVGSLQKRISDTPNVRNLKHKLKPLVENPSDDDDDHECDEGGEIHDFITSCEKCALREASLAKRISKHKNGTVEWKPLMVPDLKLWTASNNGWPKLTKRGWWTLGVCALIMLELIVADAYTPPFYADKMVGFGVDYHMPRPPFILPKLAWRHGLSTILGPFVDLVVWLFSTFAQTTGLEKLWTVKEEEWVWVYKRLGQPGSWGRPESVRAREPGPWGPQDVLGRDPYA